MQSPRQVIRLNLPLSKQDLVQIASQAKLWSEVALLLSGGEHDSASQSILGLFPYESITVNEGIFKRNGTASSLSGLSPWDALKEEIQCDEPTDPFPDWIGVIGYEMGASAYPEKEIPFHPSPTPDVQFSRFALVLVVDHDQKRVSLVIRKEIEEKLNPEQIPHFHDLQTEQGWVSLLKEEVSVSPSPTFKMLQPGEEKQHYLKKIRAIQDRIRDGEVYQVNLSQRYLLEGACDPFVLFQKVTKNNPAPFSGYLSFNDFTVISSSPERFLKKRGPYLEARPIKGTAPRGMTPEEDVALQKELIQSEKEKAELVMITDLMRNDLSRVSKPGSVSVEEIWRCEAYTNVFHLISIICSEIKQGIHPISIIRACFPGGSITGCPKLRAMEVIAEMEKRPRGVYTGSIGYFAPNGDFDFNIAIRTMVYQKNQLEIQLGGAIVIDSDPEKEYEETLHKGKTLFQALNIK